MFLHLSQSRIVYLGRISIILISPHQYNLFPEGGKYFFFFLLQHSGKKRKENRCLSRIGCYIDEVRR
jgi:hypothetical protein